MSDVTFVLLSSSHFPALRECTGIKIVRYDFSDPQAGKDTCDRGIATVHSHVRRNINEGHDIKSASDMVEGWHRFLWPVIGC